MTSPPRTMRTGGSRSPSPCTSLAGAIEPGNAPPTSAWWARETQ